MRRGRQTTAARQLSTSIADSGDVRFNTSPQVAAKNTVGQVELSLAPIEARHILPRANEKLPICLFGDFRSYSRFLDFSCSVRRTIHQIQRRRLHRVLATREAS